MQNRAHDATQTRFDIQPADDSTANLISDSPLVAAVVEFLRSRAGGATAIDIAREALDLEDLDAAIACALVKEVIEDDARLRFHGAGARAFVRLVEDDAGAPRLDETEFVVVDVETTGARTPPCRVIEIGAYRIARSEIVAEFHTLVNPETEIPPFIAGLTGITNEMTKNAPRFVEIFDAWLRFIKGAVLVAHNSAFDTRFLNHEIGLLQPQRRMANAHLCTVALARRLLPALPNHRLHTVAEHFSIRIPRRHRAPDDARATAEIFIRFLELVSAHGVRDVTGLRRFKMQ